MNKRFIMVLVAIMAACTVALAQTEYRINQAGSSGNTFEISCPSGGSSENSPAALLYDSGGASGNFSANESYTREIASNNAGAISLKFTQFNIGTNGATMTIKDAISQQILVSNATGTSLNGRTFTSNRGSLQIIWTSGSGTTAQGFAAKIWCGDMCQTFQTTINPSVSPTSFFNEATGQNETYYDVCNGTAVSFTASTHFDVPSGGQYDQSESTLIYHWGIINSNNDTVRPQGQTGQTLNYTFTESGGFLIICTAEDTRGCLNRNVNTKKVRVSLRPTWERCSFGPDSICPGATVSLHGEPTVEPWTAIRPPVIAGATFLPDGNGVCYNTSLEFDFFADGATITSANDIERVYLNMEHSYLGDLSMVLQCPNGQMCLLHGYSGGTTVSSIGWSNHGGVNNSGSCGGSSTHLGHAPDPGTSSDCYYIQGEGYSYNFTPTATAPFGDGGPRTYTSYTDPCGTTESSYILNEGDYATYENMSSLVGCPLNGTWTIYVCDHLTYDNGWIFEWGLYFAANLYPNDTWSFTNTYTTGGYSWSGVGMTSGQNGSANATAAVQNPNADNWSEIPYTFSATDDFGCTYDTTLLVHVKPAHHADCCIEPTPTVTAASTNPCGNSTTLSAGSFAYPQNTGQWSYEGPGTATFSSPNQPITDVTVNVYGDYTFTWREYYMGNETCTGDASVSVNFAREMNATLDPVANCCRSGSVIQLNAPDFGTLTCNQNTEALNLDARTFTPGLANPGSYSITNTITGERCASPATSTITFQIFDEIVISNRSEECNRSMDPAHPSVDVTFSINGLNAGSNPPQYNITGSYTEYQDNQFGTATPGTISANDQTANSFSFTRHSALDYALTVSDVHGCSSVGVAGYFACDCPYFAGTFASYSPHILCTGDTYPVGNTTEGHLGDQNDEGTFSYIICTDPNDINNSWVATLPGNTTTIALGSFNGRNGVQYYLVAVEGQGEGLNAWTSGCRSVSQAVPLMWKERPVPTVTGGETCGLVIQLNGSAVPDGMNGYWTATAPDGVNNYSYTTIENTTNIMNNPRVLSSHYGRVTYTWHLVNAECDGTASAVYNFRQIPSPEAGPDITVCGVTAEITGANPTIPAIEGSSLQWTGSGVVMTPANSIQPVANANSAGTYVLTLTERNGECAGSDNMTITFINVPAPATTANVDTVCGHVAELQVYNTNPANEGRWTAYDLQGNVLPSVIYHNYNNPNSASSDRYPHCLVSVPIPDDQTQVEYEFRWSEPISDPRIPDDASCIGEAVKRVVFRKVPVISVHQCGSTGNHVAVCGRTVELCAETAASDGYTDYVWMCKEIAGNFADSSQVETTFTLDTSIHVTRYSDVDIYFIGRNQSCISIDTMHVRFLQRPVADAGRDHIACGNSYELNGVWSLQPNELDGYVPTCQWTVGEKPNPSAQVTWTNTPHDSIVEGVQVSDYGIYTFIVREINTMGDAATCFDRDTVTVEFMEIPNVNAGQDFDVCGLDFQLHAISSHVEGDSIVGTWVSSSGGVATFTDRNDPNTTGHYSAYGPATFRWVETNHPHIQTDNQETCSADDEVTVTFYEIPSAVISMNEGDTAVCGLTFSYLRAENPGDGIAGFWYEVNPSTQFGPSNATVNSTITDVSVSSYGKHDFYWIEYTGPADNQRFCKDTAGPWTIEFIQEPDANITRDQVTFCGKDGAFSNTDVIFNGIGEGRWSTNASSSILTFEDRSDPHTSLHSEVYNSGNYANPYYEIYWTVQNTEYCTDKDTIKVIFAEVPSDSIKVIPPKCFGGPAIITAYQDSLAVYDWEFGNGWIDTTYLNAAEGEYRAFVHWEDRLETHVIGLTTTNFWGCQSAIGRAIVEEPYLPEYSYTIIGDTCGLGKGGIEFLDTTGIFSFFWIDTTVGPTITNPAMGYAITDFHVYNLPAGTYTYRSDYQTFNLEYLPSYQQYFNNDTYCHDYPRVEVGTIGMIEAEFAVSADVILSNLVAPEAEVTFVNSTNYDNVGKKCEWHFGDGVVEKNCDEFVKHTYTEPGCYEPYLIVMNRDLQECRDTAFLDECVFVDKESKLDVPNIFSPNGDGINDFFQVNAQTLKTFNGKILNRYGRVVFEWTDWENEDAGWDGRLNGSTKGTPGVYYYIIEAEGFDGVPYSLEGALHLVR